MYSITSNTKRLKQLNTELVKIALIKSGYGTNKSIARDTGLSVATCANILNELIEKGEVIEVEGTQPDVGRPARQFVYNANYAHAACIYLEFIDGIYTINYSIVNILSEILEEKKIIVDDIEYNTIDSLIGSLIAKNKLIKTIGIGIPGVTSKNNVIENCDIPKLLDLPLAELLEKKYLTKVFVENNMNIIAYGLYEQQDYDEEKNVVVVSFPKDHCVGSGIIINGEVIKGNSNFAGEISYLPFNMTQDKLSEVLDTKDGLLSIGSKIITSIIALINPALIAFEGNLLDKDIIGSLREICCESIPEKHLPEFLFIEDVHSVYMNGLISMTLESFSCDVQLVSRRNNSK